MQMRELIDSGVMKELAERLGAGERARGVLEDIGFPSSRLPVGNDDAEIFWRRVFRELDAGVIRDGFDMLLSRVQRDFSGNPVFARAKLPDAKLHSPISDTHKQSVEPAALKDPKPKPAKIFICYSHKDESMRSELETHLKLMQRLGCIETWHDRMILGGQEWESQIDASLQSSNIIFLLVSADFLASDYCYGVEMKAALARHEKREARVIPIILRPVDLKGSPFSKLQFLPRDGKPVSQWLNRDEAYLNVAEGIRAVIGC